MRFFSAWVGFRIFLVGVWFCDCYLVGKVGWRRFYLALSVCCGVGIIHVFVGWVVGVVWVRFWYWWFVPGLWFRRGLLLFGW